MKDIFETEIHRIDYGQVREAIERPPELSFLKEKECQYFVENRLAQHAARTPDEQPGVFKTLEPGRRVHDAHRWRAPF
jgi:hypothetical protein